MKKVLCFILCLNLGLTLISCSSNNNANTESSKSEEISDNSNDSATNQEDENTDTQESQKSTNDTATTNTTNTTSNTTQTTENKTSNLITLTTYTADSDTLAIKTLSTIQVEESLSLQDKLTKLANELSTKGFQGLPITVVRVETINGVKKATINLEDSKNNPNIGWYKTYFQGSSMSSVTTKKLIETFRQKSYPGDWIGYVEFLYNNNPIETEHTDELSSIINLK